MDCEYTVKATTSPTTGGGTVGTPPQRGLPAGVPATGYDAQAAALKPKGGNWAQIVRANFDRWDKNGDGWISEAECAQLIGDSSLTSDESIAVATLHHRIEVLEEVSNDEVGDENDGLHKDDLAALEKGHKPGDERSVGGKTESTHNHWKNKVAGQRKSLWPPKGQPLDITEVGQGSIGDCSTLATLLSLAVVDEAKLRSMIADNGDGTFTVTFPQHKPLHIPKITDGEIARGVTGGQNGLWPQVLEKAFALLENQAAKEELPQDAIEGRQMRDSVGVFGGSGADVDDLIVTALDTTRKKLTVAFAQKRIVTAEIGGLDGEREGMAQKHAYAVIGWDAAGDDISIYNPHGSGEWAGTKDKGFKANDGKWTMPLTEFDRLFTNICYQE